ncbi:EF-P beta-lysylation protein EpmB [Symmachiella dynata]|uniref:EF-P beta-lysylation protein EpmB n=1 Tax=Symmachiella dynata TaxID=2527995 RepID=UPI0030EBE543
MPTPPATTRQTLSLQQDTANWHRALAAAVRDPDELIDLLGLDDDYREPARRAARLFPLLVPRNYLERIEPGNPRDPLLLQVLPLAAEETVVDGFSADAVGDAQAHRSPGLLQKYAGRALLITTGACAVHCRYCFRRKFPYGEEPRTLEDWVPAFADIAADSSLHEIILSGGDPLMLTDARLAMFIERLDRIEHLRRLRIHTRLPIVLPQRVTSTLLEMITSTRLTPIVVVHANHAHELQGDCAAALRELVRGGVTVLNQAVLLRDINDTTESQAELCERLVNLGVIPYYLHQLDRVSGAAHFEVPEQTGRVIIAELRERLPGYAVPQFVREIAGELHKTPL